MTTQMDKQPPLKVENFDIKDKVLHNIPKIEDTSKMLEANKPPISPAKKG